MKTIKYLRLLAGFTVILSFLQCKSDEDPVKPNYPELVTIPATNADFFMGCNGGALEVCNPDELPVHTVSLSTFQISETEITQAQWLEVMGTKIDNPSYNNACQKCPVESVSWYDAVVFCNRLSELQGLVPCYYSNYNPINNTYSEIYGRNGTKWSLPNSGIVYWNPVATGYRLPTEAEWERAARGGINNQIYSGSNDVTSVAWYDSNSGGESKPVKTGKNANLFRLYDMSGNVSEWCYDWYDEYPSNNILNPSGPVAGVDRVFRGGSSFDFPRNCRAATRDRNLPTFRDQTLGFRVARFF
jgi:formylglycine-generating enzyme required for sulfatase activity